MLSVFGNTFDESDLNAMKEVMDSHLVGMGDKTKAFEAAFAKKIGFKYGIGTNSCTNAFWIILTALNIGEKDHVLIPNIHFFGVRNILDLLKIQWTAIDTQKDIPNLSIESIRDQVLPETKAIIFLEYGGYPVDIKSIKDYLASIKRTDIKLILDAANSPFTIKDGSYTALNYDIAAYSFDMNKILVTGDGGMILTDDPEVAIRCKSLSYYGISDLHKSGFEKSKSSDVWWEVDISTPSLKLPMNNLTAALGINQLSKVESFLNRRAEIAQFYRKELDGVVTLPQQPENVKNNTYLFWLLTKKELRNKLAKHLKDDNIYCTVKYQPLSTKAPTSNAFHFYESALCIPMHQNLTNDNLQHIVTSIQRFYA